MKKQTMLNVRMFFILSVLFLSMQTIKAQFTAGAGGNLPTFPTFAYETGEVGGLYVMYSQRANNTYTSGTKAVVDLKFPVPSSFGADTYTLQYSTDEGQNWSNYQYYNEDLTTPGDNFSLSFEGSYWLRLKLNGGEKDGYYSNTVYAPLSTVDTRFSGWGLDESMFLTGIMAPNVGRGLLADFTVKKLSDESVIEGYLTYQWYRVNPMTYEMTEIEDATNLDYTTTDADVGYLLSIKATGDETNVGGFAQIFAYSETIISNNAFVSNASSSGFTLNLYKSPSGLAISDLTLYDKDYNEVTISSVTQGANSAIYDIAATLDPAKSSYNLENNSRFWRIVSQDSGQNMTMEGVSIDLTTGIDKINDLSLSVYPIPAVEAIHFKSKLVISRAEILNLSGDIMLQSAINSNEGNLNTSKLSSGVYLLRLETTNGRITKKIQVTK
ncbi:MAG: T9SS type A sorting domain-containing protein [Paludibacteraceae bacterium]|nr:T9SS type A sorting domain-containing protein [Paludibacteraceae bacterium]